MKKPYLTSVMCARNDKYGGNALERMQSSITNRLELFEKYHLDSEFIIVEWNPPYNRPPIREIIEWPHKLRFCTVRILEVPAHIHKRYKHSDILNLNVIVALNCGIRRSRGLFVLPGNIDLLYSPELVRFIAQKKLNFNKRYRINRSDVDRNVLRVDKYQEQIEYCKNNIIYENDIDQNRRRLISRFVRDFPDLHTMACGDFQLLSRSLWHHLRGYIESDIISAYSDTLLSYASYAAGVDEVVLKKPLRLYHIDHDNKFTDRSLSEYFPGKNLKIWDTMPKKLSNNMMFIYKILLFFLGYQFTNSIEGIETRHYFDCIKICYNMVFKKVPYILNDANWGLRDDKLDEYVVNIADWDSVNG